MKKKLSHNSNFPMTINPNAISKNEQLKIDLLLKQKMLADSDILEIVKLVSDIAETGSRQQKSVIWSK